MVHSDLAHPAGMPTTPATTALAQRLHSAFTIPDTRTLPSGLAVAVVVSSASCEKKTTRLGRKPVANISTLPQNYVLMFGKASATLPEQHVRQSVCDPPRAAIRPTAALSSTRHFVPATCNWATATISYRSHLSSRFRRRDAGQSRSQQHARLLDMLFRLSALQNSFY
jgi:hypothetical protein